LSQVAKKETPPQLTVRTISTFKIVEIPPEELKKKNIPSPAELLANLQKKIQKMEAELDKKTRALAKIPRRTVISAATKEHLYADYMEDWRRKIERVGNMNYPSDATGDVILHMSIRANGTVEKLRIIHAADSSAINEAAMNIAQLAAPFAPFPKKIREKTDIIDIIRTWRFIREEQDIRVN
jgi:protein TonB